MYMHVNMRIYIHTYIHTYTCLHIYLKDVYFLVGVLHRILIRLLVLQVQLVVFSVDVTVVVPWEGDDEYITCNNQLK